MKNDTCLCIHALDGFETYKIDENTIGVRPIWFDPVKNPPPPTEDVLCWCVSLEATTGFQKEERYAAIDRWCKWTDSHAPSFRTDRFYAAKVIYWMPLPKLPITEEIS